MASADCLPRKLGRQDIDLLDGGRLREEFGSRRLQSGSDTAGEVGLPARLIREGVEDAERGRPQADRKPRGRRRLLLDQRQTSAEEALDFRFPSRFGFESNQQC